MVARRCGMKGGYYFFFNFHISLSNIFIQAISCFAGLEGEKSDAGRKGGQFVLDR